jgi:hypothetical protein
VSHLEGALAALADCFRHLSDRDLGALFSASFLAQTPEPLLRAQLDRLTREFGVVDDVRVCEQLSDRSARIRLRFSRGYATHGEMAIDDDTPIHIQWLRLDLPTREADSWDAIATDVRALSGRTSFEVRNLTRRTTLAVVNRDEQLGVGSVSKLPIFSALLSEVAAGRRRWDDVVRLEERDLSLPTGILQDWPVGAPLTLHTVATLLLSLSDNTAADLLLRELGRERVEAELAGLPLADPTRHRPYFSTRGIFALVADEAQRRAWAAADERGRRELLAAAELQPVADVACVTGPWPEGWDWMWSAGDLSALLDHLRVQLAESPIGRSLLGVNKGLGIAAWPFAGFKGGSSAGRMAFAVLLADDHDQWFGVAIANNATPETHSPDAIVQLVKRAIDHLGA